MQQITEMKTKPIDRTIVIVVLMICITLCVWFFLWHDYMVHHYEGDRVEQDIRHVLSK